MMTMISPLQPKALLTSEFILKYRRVLLIQTNPYQALNQKYNNIKKYNSHFPY